MSTKKTFDELMAELQEPELPFLQAAGPDAPDAWEDVPDEYTPRITHPPGDYVLRLPPQLSALWESFEIKDAQGQPVVEFEGDKSIRVRMLFSELDALTIVRGPAGFNLEGQAFDTRIDNRARVRNFNDVAKGAAPIKVSDMEYLLRALGCAHRPGTGMNRQFMALFNGAPALNHPGYGGQVFTATWEWEGYCNPTKGAQALLPADATHPTPYVDSWIDPQTQQPRMGCGARTYQADWNKEMREVGGRQMQVFAARTNCKGNKKKAGCTYALVYPYGKLRNFRPAPPGVK